MVTFGFGGLYSIHTPVTPFIPNGMRTGTNLTSYESVTYNQYDPASGPPPGNYPVHSTTLLNYLIGQGVKHVRFTFSWEAVQSNIVQNTGDPAQLAIPSSIGGNYQTYWNRMITTVNYLLANDVHVMLTPWQYNAAILDTDICYQGASFTTDSFGQFWTAFITAVNAETSNDQNVSFSLINEPHAGAITAGGDVTEWTTYAQTAIDYIRGDGSTNIIYVPGYNYSDCASYVSGGSAAEFLKLSDPTGRLGVYVDNYNGQLTRNGNTSSTTALRDAIAPVVAWSRANGNIPIHVGELAVDAGQPNGTLAVAQAQWADWQAYCLANNDIITGWDWWATSEHGWWSTNDSSAGSNWGLTSTSDTTASTYMTLIQSTLGTF